MKKYTITKEQLFKAADDCADAACVKTLTKELERVMAELASAVQQASDGEKGWLLKYSDTCAELERVQRQNAALLAELRFWSGEHKHAGDCEFGEEGCYLCRNAERERFLKITKPLLANADADDVPRAEVDALKRQNAAMREALEKAIGHYSRHAFLLRRLYEILPHPLAWTNENMRIVEKVEHLLREKRPRCINAALSPDADADAELLTKEQVKPLVEAVKYCHELLEHARGLSLPSYTALHNAKGSAFAALAHARSLGF